MEIRGASVNNIPIEGKLNCISQAWLQSSREFVDLHDDAHEMKHVS